MIKNYLVLAWRVLGRKKFFTFITLFGISFTLMVLMVLVSFYQMKFSEDAPMKNMNELLLMDRASLMKRHYDTIMIVDSVVDVGLMNYDTSYQINNTGRDMSRNSLGREMLLENFVDLESTIDETIFDTSVSFDVFVNNSKIHVNAIYCDPNYWDIFNFRFLEGRAFDLSEFDQQLQVTIITTKMAFDYFGRETDVLDENVVLEGKQYRVIGVVEAANSGIPFVKAEVFMPYSLLEISVYEDYYFGGFNMALLSSGNMDKTKDEVKFITSQISTDKHEYYNELMINASTIKEKFAQGMFYSEDASESLFILSWVIFGILSLFILLPVLNLINLNVSRMMDRSSEIGVRRAFGATRNQILGQFIFENIVQTILGGIIGLCFTYFVIYLINDGHVLGDSKLSMNSSFFIISFFLTIIFGVLSGFIPAFKMAKLHIINALKSVQL